MNIGYALNGSGGIRCFDTGCPLADGEVAFDHVPSAAEISAVFPDLATALAAEDLKAAALSALTDSDTTIIRCMSAGVVVPADWQSYRASLRAIANGTDSTSTALPDRPDYPSGT